MKIYAYTDGAASPNPGPGAWAYILITLIEKASKQPYLHIREEIGFENFTTNNRMELISILSCLLAIKSPKTTDIIIYTDSQWCVGALTKDWSIKKNVDLIYQIKPLMNQFNSIVIKWIRGHSGNRYNEKVDQLANRNIWKRKTGYKYFKVKV